MKCGGGTSAAGLEDREGLCANCFRLSKLAPYDDAEAERTVQQHYRQAGHFDGSGGVLPFMKRTMLPPPGAEEWKLHHVVELDSRRFPW